jgi:hypothetical protein
MNALLERLRRLSYSRFADLMQYFDVDMTLLSTKGRSMVDIIGGRAYEMVTVVVGIVLKGLRHHAG